MSYADVILAAGPRAYWRLGEAAGPCIDATGGGNSGTPLGNPSRAVVGAIADDGGIGLDGSIQYIAVPDAAALDVGNVFTIEAWVRRTGTGTIQTIVDKGSNACQLRFNAADRLELCKSGVSIIVASTVTVTDREWHHVVATKNGASVFLYLDGVGVTGAVTDATCLDNAVPLEIGRSSFGGGSQYYNGALDEVAIYATALAWPVVVTHYQNRAGLEDAPAAELAVPVVNFREPYPPHRIRARARVSGLRYGFGLGDGNTASFAIAKADPNLPGLAEIFDVGAMVTIERADGCLPWVGFVTGWSGGAGGDSYQFQLGDHAKALLAAAHVRRGAQLTAPAGSVISQLYREANALGIPPLLAELQLAAGPVISYTPQAGTVLEMLNAVAAAANHEWRLYHQVGREVKTTLILEERAGHDLSGAVVWEGGRHFTQLTFSRSAGGYNGAAAVVGGSGSFADREAVIVSSAGAAGLGIARSVAGWISASPRSPALQRTAVLVEQLIGGPTALQARAARALEQPDDARELFEGVLAEKEINVRDLELGNYVTIRDGGLDLGRAIERVARVTAFQLGTDGKITVTLTGVDYD